VVLSILIVGIIAIYMKRQSLQNIKITKTAVAKSNSYKSNVGCKCHINKNIRAQFHNTAEIYIFRAKLYIFQTILSGLFKAQYIVYL